MGGTGQKSPEMDWKAQSIRSQSGLETRRAGHWVHLVQGNCWTQNLVWKQRASLADALRRLVTQVRRIPQPNLEATRSSWTLHWTKWHPLLQNVRQPARQLCPCYGKCTLISSDACRTWWRTLALTACRPQSWRGWWKWLKWRQCTCPYCKHCGRPSGASRTRRSAAWCARVISLKKR